MNYNINDITLKKVKRIDGTKLKFKARPLTGVMIGAVLMHHYLISVDKPLLTPAQYAELVDYVEANFELLNHPQKHTMTFNDGDLEVSKYSEGTIAHAEQLYSEQQNKPKEQDMSAFSRNKGKRAEREIVNLLQPIIDRVYAERDDVPQLQRNTLQSDKGGFDIVGIDFIALEVKFQESYHLDTWWDQTKAQCGRLQLPVLLYRRSRVPWRAQMFGYLGAGSKRVRTRVDVDIEAFKVWFEVLITQHLNGENVV